MRHTSEAVKRDIVASRHSGESTDGAASKRNYGIKVSIKFVNRSRSRRHQFQHPFVLVESSAFDFPDSVTHRLDQESASPRVGNQIIL
jgi:hypothetical protein